MKNTKIEWTHPPGYQGDTWNPIRGCSRVSEGCRNCYAETVAHRFGGPGQPYEGLTVVGNDGPRWNGKIMFVEGHLEDPLRRKHPTCYFVNSMSDLFHENISFEIIDKIFAVMALCPQHIFQILTKRSERMREYIETRKRYIAVALEMEHITFALGEAGKDWNGKTSNLKNEPFILSNVWLGVSVEDQKTADARIPILLDTPAAVNWISAEPLLGPIDLKNYFRCDCGEDTLDKILDWVVVGGESGAGARPMHPDWVTKIIEDCTGAKCPVFFKQWGEYIWTDEYPTTDDLKIYTPFTGIYGSGDQTAVYKVGKKKAGRLLDGKEYSQFPEVSR